MIDRRALFAFALAACSTAQSPAVSAPVEVARAPEAGQTQRAPDRTAARCGAVGGIQIEGQLGTIPSDNVRRVVRDGNQGLEACFRRRLSDAPFIAGRVELKLRVGADGAVRWAVPTASTVGDRGVERCMIEHARTLRFSEPCGGEAEVSTSIEMDGGPDVRPAVVLPPTRFATPLRQRRAQLAACRGAYRGEVRVTAYVARDGSIACAGASAADTDALAVGDCALNEMRSWRVPTPGSWYARITFNLP